MLIQKGSPNAQKEIWEIESDKGIFFSSYLPHPFFLLPLSPLNAYPIVSCFFFSNLLEVPKG
jgi:hypothetical protein